MGNKGTAKRALRETRLVEVLQLKGQMSVMLIHNLDVSSKCVNGKIATIEYMEYENICLRKKLPDGNNSNILDSENSLTSS